jgi:hypothetical protein
MKMHFRFLLLSFLISLSIIISAGDELPVSADSTSPYPAPYQTYLPLALSQAEATHPIRTGLIPLPAFIQAVTDGQAERITGLYVDGVLAQRVVQQPDDNPQYISGAEDEVTQYGLAKEFGVTGLIAHNNLAGKIFFDLKIGQVVEIIYGDGKLHTYQITETARFQALAPASFTSGFIDLNNGATLTAAQLFTQYYMGGDHVTFQTCIAQDNVANWGRLFVLAMPQTQAVAGSKP